MIFSIMVDIRVLQLASMSGCCHASFIDMDPRAAHTATQSMSNRKKHSLIDIEKEKPAACSIIRMILDVG